jgi:ATP-dependent Clp protease ATP-binding subunit ClpA
VIRFDPDARAQVLRFASDEAARDGHRRIGTHHLLLGLLRDPTSEATRAVGADLRSARAASLDLDMAALAAVGVDATPADLAAPTIRTRRRPPFTAGARAALARGVRAARAAKARRVEPRHLLLGVLGCQRPDPAAELLDALGVDRAAARERLAGP